MYNRTQAVFLRICWRRCQASLYALHKPLGLACAREGGAARRSSSASRLACTGAEARRAFASDTRCCAGSSPLLKAHTFTSWMHVRIETLVKKRGTHFSHRGGGGGWQHRRRRRNESDGGRRFEEKQQSARSNMHLLGSKSVKSSGGHAARRRQRKAKSRRGGLR